MPQPNELIFGKYEIIRRIAIGGMGEIFLAKQHGIPGFERLAILKNLLPHLANQNTFVEQFLDEARLAATLNHPNIVAVYEVGQWSGEYYIAMEHIRGVSLGRLLAHCHEVSTPVFPSVAARIIHDVCLGLVHAHNATNTDGEPLNIVHRDISPSNIMVREDGNTKIVDFGVARAANRVAKTATGDIKGKVAYMSPEQISQTDLDARSDQFSLGVVFWEMLTGKRLFATDNALSTMAKITRDPIPSPAEEIPDLPDELIAITMRMLARDPDNRYPDCQAAADAIREFMDTLSGRVGEPSVADFVRKTCADYLDEVLSMARSGVTPTGNFVLDLRSGSQPDNGSGDILTLPVSTPPGDATISLSTGERSDELSSPSPPSEGLQPDSSVTPEAATPRAKRKYAIAGLAVAGLLAVTVGIGAQQLSHPEHPEADESSSRTVAQGNEAAGGSAGTTSNESPGLITGTVNLSSSPAGATVRVGTLVLGETPLTIETLVANTAHTLHLEKDGYASEEVEITIDADIPLFKDVILEESPPPNEPAASPAVAARPQNQQPTPRHPPRPAPTSPGRLTVSTKPWTVVQVAGERLETPFSNHHLPAGTVELHFVNSRESIDAACKATIRSGKTTKIKIDFNDSSTLGARCPQK